VPVREASYADQSQGQGLRFKKKSFDFRPSVVTLIETGKQSDFPSGAVF
jgi:hypothetical protein